jgi:hypothetical protein
MKTIKHPSASIVIGMMVLNVMGPINMASSKNRDLSFLPKPLALYKKKGGGGAVGKLFSIWTRTGCCCCRRRHKNQCRHSK